MIINDCSCWQYTIYADIPGGSFETRRQTSIFMAFWRYGFGSLGNEANIII